MTVKSRASSNNQRAREKNLNYNLHSHDLQFMLDYYDGRCAYCSTELLNDNFQVDHIIPITEDSDDVINFGSVLYNIVPCCIDCNQNKGVKNVEEWLNENFSNANEILYKLHEYQIICGIDEIIW